MTRTKGAKDKGKRKVRAVETEPRTETFARVLELELSGLNKTEIAEVLGIRRQAVQWHLNQRR